MPKITKRVVDAAAPDEGRRYIVWDTELRGFGLLVLPSGVKSYVFQYRTPEGRERRATIGKHGAWTAEEARARADEMRRAVNEGRDPLEERKERRDALTVAELLDAYVEGERFKQKAATTQAIDKGRIQRHLKPAIGKKIADTLTPGDVERAFAMIRDGKTSVDVKTKRRGRARVTGGEGTARMAIRLLSSAMSWAIGSRIVKTNPCMTVRIGTDGSRTTIIEDAEGYARLFRALDRLEQEKRVRAAAADAIRVIALTGSRRGEIIDLRWRQLDLKRGLITLPPKEHKAGRKTGKARIIGLPAAAQVIIARQSAGDPDDRVFRPARGDGPISLSKIWDVVRREANLPDGIGLHGLRHSLASHMAMSGAEAAEIMTALGHSQLSTAQKYVHWAQDARQGLAERAATVALEGMAASGSDRRLVLLPAKGGASR
jgi:integrase